MSWKRHLMLGTVLPVATLAWPGSAPGRVLLGEPDVDRASDQYDGNWCPAENHSFFGTFTADGPEVTLVIHATNWWSGIFRNEHIDNVFVTPLADYNAALHEADSTVIANYFCVFDSTDYFHFDELAQGAAIFEDRFVSGPDPRWDLTEASFNPATSGLNALVFPLDDTGGSLSLGGRQRPERSDVHDRDHHRRLHERSAVRRFPVDRRWADRRAGHRGGDLRDGVLP